MDRSLVLEFLELRPEIKTLFQQVCENKNQNKVISFSGDRGLGKFTFSQIVAWSYLLDLPKFDVFVKKMENKEEFNQTLTMLEQDIHPDLLLLPSLNQRHEKLKIDVLREELQRFLALPPQLASSKVLILDLACLTEQTQNTLLKVLEEAPSFCQFILTFHNRDTVLPTILSRTKIFTLSPLNKEGEQKLFASFRASVTAEILPTIREEQFDFSSNKDQLTWIFSMSRGNPGMLLDLMANTEVLQLRNRVLQLLLNLFSSNLADILLEVEEIGKVYKKNAFFLFRTIAYFLKDASFLTNLDKKLGKVNESEILSEYKDFLLLPDYLQPLLQLVQSKVFHNFAWQDVLFVLEDVQANLEFNVNFDLSLQHLFIVLSRANK